MLRAHRDGRLCKNRAASACMLRDLRLQTEHESRNPPLMWSVRRLSPRPMERLSFLKVTRAMNVKLLRVFPKDCISPRCVVLLGLMSMSCIPFSLEFYHHAFKNSPGLLLPPFVKCSRQSYMGYNASSASSMSCLLVTASAQHSNHAQNVPYCYNHSTAHRLLSCLECISLGKYMEIQIKIYSYVSDIKTKGKR